MGKYKIVSLSVIIMAVLFVAIFLQSSYVKAETAPEADESSFALPSIGFNEYLAYHDMVRPDAQIIIDAADFILSTTDSPVIIDNFSGQEGLSLLVDDEDVFTWEVVVEEAGFYQIYLLYYPVEGRGASIERAIYINGAIPFRGAANISFPRVWANETNNFVIDARGNELRPRQVEKPMWMETPALDSRGHFVEPLLFYFEEGVNTISIEALREPKMLRHIMLWNAPPRPTYAEYAAINASYGRRPANAEMIHIDGARAAFKSSPTLHPLNDRTSPATVPYSVSHIRMNTIGGTNWSFPNDWIIFEFEVEEAGLYNIGIRYRQDFLRGFNVTRRIYINGEVPFSELQNVHFPFSSRWQLDTLGGDEPFAIYFTEGTHQIKMQLTLGDLVDVIREIEESVLELNAIYRTILAVTGPNPDPFRDYQLARNIPGLLDELQVQRDNLYSIAASLESILDQRSEQTATIINMVTQLDNMIRRPDNIPRRLTHFNASIGGLGAIVFNVTNQPLTINYLVLVPDGGEMPRAEASWFRRLWHEIRAFFASFTIDFDAIGTIDEDVDTVIDVWISTGRDQAHVLKAMIDDTFTPHTNIGVNFRLVGEDVILPATLAGQGPDVAMQMGNAVPVNFGIRNAVYDLATFHDFDYVAARFRESALVPLSFDGQVFGLPEQQIFPMMFYRTDILGELGLSVPQTWYDVFDMIPELHVQHMDFGFPPMGGVGISEPNPTFSMFLLQHGGRFYTEGGLQSDLFSDEAVRAFIKWTDLYNLYEFPVNYDFVNRFRIGEMPIGIANYTTYNMLSVFAPEIRGMWQFAPVPGIMDEYGHIRRDVASTGTAVIIMQSSRQHTAAWEYLKWWTAAEQQVRFGREMEGLMGAAARHPTANVEALELLPWPVRDFRNLEEQWQWVHGVPEVPGSYFTGRHISNAFFATVNRNLNPRETLRDYVERINNEITSKRLEFNLPVVGR